MLQFAILGTQVQSGTAPMCFHPPPWLLLSLRYWSGWFIWLCLRTWPLSNETDEDWNIIARAADECWL